MKRKIIAIIGPTASGKTAIGVKLAKKFNGEIVSADSRQVFRGLDLGTGKEGLPCKQDTITKKQDTNNQQYNPTSPRLRRTSNLTIEQLKCNLRYIDGIPQWLIDVADPCTSGRYRARPEEDYNMFKWLDGAKIAIEDILSRGKLPIIVGGTGLYVQALVEGFALKRIQKTDNRIQQSREQLEKKTVEQLQDILKKVDEDSFKGLADKKNQHRLIRAIERALSGEEMTKVKPDWEALQIGIDLPRETLNQRIDKRADDRFKLGMLQEIEGLIKLGVNKEWLTGLGLEYRIIGNFILGCHSETRGRRILKILRSPRLLQDDREFELMKDELKLRSHQYAKRQMTWFKRFSEIKWEKDYSEIKELVEKFNLSN